MKKCESQKFHKVVEPHIATKPRVVEATDRKIFAYESCEHPKAPGVHGNTAGAEARTQCRYLLSWEMSGYCTWECDTPTVLILNLLFLPQFLKQY